MATEWQPIKYDSDSIKGLVRTRLEFDKILSGISYGSRNKDVLKLIDIYRRNNDYIETYDEIIVCVYADLDRLVSKANLTKIQRDILALYGLGWDIVEIADKRDTSVQNINQILNRACNTIEEINDLEWKKWVHKNKTGNGLFVCDICGVELPKTIDFKADGENICAECEVEISNSFDD